MRTIITSITVLVLSLSAASGCGKGQRDKPKLGEVERLPRLETVRPQLHAAANPLKVVRTYTATVEAFEKADLCSQVRGYVKVVPPTTDIGQAVAKDQPLLTLDIPDILADRDNKKALLEQNEKLLGLSVQAIEVAAAEVKESQAMVQRYEAEAEYRRLQHERISQLAQNNTVSKQQAEESLLHWHASRAALAAALAQVVTKQARLQAARQEQHVAQARVEVARAELARLQVQVDFAIIRAPFNGVITKRWVDTGATVKDAAMPLLTVMRTDKVRVLLDIPERDVPYIAANGQGNRVELHMPALENSSKFSRLQGTITLAAAALDPITRTMRTEMHLNNNSGGETNSLKPQMTGTATVILAERQAVTVPSSALVRTGHKLEIFIVADVTGDPPRGIVKRLEVQLGLDDGQRVEIRHGRLSGQELVIVKGAGVIRPGEEAIAIPVRPGKNGG